MYSLCYDDIYDRCQKYVSQKPDIATIFFLNEQEPQRLPAEYISRQTSPAGGVEKVRTIGLGPFAM